MGRGESEHAFALLELAPSAELSTRETSVELLGGKVLHAMDGSGLRHLLLPLRGDEPPVSDHQSRSVIVTTRALVDADLERRFIDIRCDEPQLNDLFATVCDEVLDAVLEKPDAVGAATLTVLERWRDLLGPASTRLLSTSEVKGLLAELHVLERIADRDPASALALWTGPDASRHDFTGETIVIEVKASSLVDEVRVHVNGLTQLLAPPGKMLYLLVELMERVPVGGDAISDAIARLRTAGVQAGDLLRLLALSKVVPADLDAYAHIRFDTLELRLYIVDDAFPRLVPALLEGKPAADRVVRVEYVLDLGAQPPVPLPPAALDALAGTLLQDKGGAT